MFNLLIVFISTILIAVLTFIIFDVMNRVFRRLSSKLEETISHKTPEISNRARNKRNMALVTLSALLALSIGIYEFSDNVNSTALDPVFIKGEVQHLDISAIATEFLSGDSQEILDDTASYSSQELDYASESLEVTLTELEPWIDEQVLLMLESAYGYFLSEKPDFSIVITLKNMQESLRQHLKEAVLSSPPSELNGASQEQIQSYVDALYRQEFGKVPTEIELSSQTSNIYPEIRRAASVLSLLPIILIPLILLFSLAVVLLHRDFKAALWSIGIVLVISGILDFLYAFVAGVGGIRVDTITSVPTLNLWFVRVVSDALTAIKQPEYILFGLGGGMIILSIIWVRLKAARRVEDEPKARTGQ